MVSRTRALLVLLVGLLSAAAISVLALAVEAGAPRELLPDLHPVPPDGLVVEGGAGSYVIGFNSSTQNIGAGRLDLRAYRSSSADPTMEVEQIIHRADGSTRTVGNAGVVQYVFEEDHQHWHLRDFMRYELRTFQSFRSVGRDVKSGFCVADRRRAEGFKRPQLFPDPSWCERRKPDATELRMGLSVGWEDPYEAILEGQQIPISGVAAGRYYLVHRSNPDRKLVELDYANNLSAVVISIAWPRGSRNSPIVRQVAHCDHTGSEGRDVMRDTRANAEAMCALTGADTIHVGRGWRDTAFGGPGNDRFVARLHDGRLDGGLGSDTVDYSRLSRGVVVKLRSGSVVPRDRTGGGETLVSVESVRGSRFDDVLVGDSARNVLQGMGGHDHLTGGIGRDVLNGGSGSDRIVSRDGHRDRIACGPGTDTVLADLRDVVSGDCETVVRA